MARMPAKLAKQAAPARRNQPPLAAALLAWYGRHARTLPWRVGPKARTREARPDPYRVWLSEVMLQQTTVKAVAPYFFRFVERWPTIRDLAAADEHAVMAAWAGLGYYSRARKLIECARVVAARPGAQFPQNAGELAQLPGIGSYTSAAIAAIAFDEPIAVVDGNVERVVARLFAIDTAFPAAKPLVRKALQPMVPTTRAGEFAEALMDLGATLCTPRKPACVLCPWSTECLSRQKGLEAVLPIKAEKKARPTRYGTAFVARRADSAILLRRRPPTGLLGGMSEVPGSEWGAEPARHIGPPLGGCWTRLAVPVDHVFTHFALKLAVERSDVDKDTPAPPGCWWATALSDEALPSVMKKAIEAAYPGATKAQRKP
jgi:A/G-specific adenine glycosylase